MLCQELEDPGACEKQTAAAAAKAVFSVPSVAAGEAWDKGFVPCSMVLLVHFVDCHSHFCLPTSLI